MYIIPAIDIKDGNCVRLTKGDYDTVQKVAKNPYIVAENFKKAGAKYMHMVDLDGAKEGTMKNADLICDVAKSSGLLVDVGGGIRNMQAIEYYLNRGVNQVVLGSVAIKDPKIVIDAVRNFGDKIIVGIDAMEGKVKTEGWTDGSDIYFTELAKRMEDVGVEKFIFTDINRDGTLTGPNLVQLEVLSHSVSSDIVASGGVSDITDIRDLMSLNIFGAICGKSIYEGTLNLEDAVMVTQRKK
ncbi:MAG: 1-(5-phosphoribosyl)-5-[(5-phosphoribosylamino)methylideneamino]imidazole-4-carboxamide isomerase [Oscillospiraceae bacterium]|nr:1-(5-phosphoribosyl)-5-[(5-phosphoribosylamino)methylideneamino]imidazole-4-carboxamide isomerase [Oscillospiraceae bacterium]